MSIGSVGGFTGISTYATALQTALNRALSIASLPLQQLSADQGVTTDKSNELDQISSLLSSLQNALQPLASGTGNSALAASSTDPSVVQASLTGNAFAGSYTIQVLDPGSSSSVLSDPANTLVTDPSSQNISASTSFTLTVGGNQFTIQPGAQSLNALAQSINSSGAGVQATVINLGSPTAPDYRLAIQSTSLGDVPIQLNDGTTDLLDPVTTGTTGSYTVNGQPPGGISTNSSTVTIAPGLSVTLEKAGTTTVTVAGNTTAISNALTSFVNAFNTLQTELSKNHGKGGGALTGDSSISTIQNTLRNLVNFAGGSGSVTSLSNLGITFTQQGTLTFDSTKLDNLSQGQINDVVSFLGDPTSGGFLQTASDTLNSLLDPVNGLVANEQQSFQTQITRENHSISDEQDRLTQLQTSLQAQMAAADTLIATLQQQTQFIDGLFQIGTLNANGTIGNNKSNG